MYFEIPGLSGFEEQVESDLLQAICERFPEADQVDEWRTVTLQHEDAAISNTENFVGRTQLIESLMKHCTSRQVNTIHRIAENSAPLKRLSFVAYWT